MLLHLAIRWLKSHRACTRLIRVLSACFAIVYVSSDCHSTDRSSGGVLVESDQTCRNSGIPAEHVFVDSNEYYSSHATANQPLVHGSPRTRRSPGERRINNELILIPGGTCLFGTDSHIGYAADTEGPMRNATVHTSFYIAKYEVTNEEFADFVESTGYITDSERYDWSFVFHAAIPRVILDGLTSAVSGAEWWSPVPGAGWAFPEGKLYLANGANAIAEDTLHIAKLPESAENGLSAPVTPKQEPYNGVFAAHFYRGDHPAVHLSWTDADAFCRWRYNHTSLAAGDGTSVVVSGRLPTEIEWEHAARGRSGCQQDLKYPWGDKIMAGKAYHANYYQGNFPARNTAADGYEYLAPVDAYSSQNDYGLYNVIGNAWEWVEDDWTTHGEWKGWDLEGGDAQSAVEFSTGEKAKKGGSFLCHHSYCNRYRIAARTQSTPDSASMNTGVRCAASLV